MAPRRKPGPKRRRRDSIDSDDDFTYETPQTESGGLINWASNHPIIASTVGIGGTLLLLNRLEQANMIEPDFITGLADTAVPGSGRVLTAVGTRVRDIITQPLANVVDMLTGQLEHLNQATRAQFQELWNQANFNFGQRDQAIGLLLQQGQITASQVRFLYFLLQTTYPADQLEYLFQHFQQLEQMAAAQDAGAAANPADDVMVDPIIPMDDDDDDL